VQLWLSLFVEIEVAYLDGMTDDSSEHTILDFLAEDYVVLVMIDPSVSEIARKLIRHFHIHGKDAVHVASAIRWNAPVFDTFDRPLITKLNAGDPNGLLGGLVVREPTYEGQRRLDDPPLA